MANLTTFNPVAAFRDVAAKRMHTAADMSLHELVDEFQRLTLIVEAGTEWDDNDGYSRSMNVSAKVAFRERSLINMAAQSRFGISFDAFDRADDADIPF